MRVTGKLRVGVRRGIGWMFRQEERRPNRSWRGGIDDGKSDGEGDSKEGFSGDSALSGGHCLEICPGKLVVNFNLYLADTQINASAVGARTR